MIFLSCIFIYLCIEIIVKWIYFNAGVSLEQIQREQFQSVCLILAAPLYSQ